MTSGLYGIAVLSESGEIYAPDHEVSGALAAAEPVATRVALGDVGAVLMQALTELMAAFPLDAPAQPGVLWRNQTFLALSPNADGSAYVAPYGVGLSGVLDPVTALLPILVPRVLRDLATTPPAGAGMLWLNSGRLALSPALDGTPYPVTPLPTSGVGLLPVVRAALGPWLAATMPALPRLAPISRGALWRGTNLLSVS